jgi:hypothetical protein
MCRCHRLTRLTRLLTLDIDSAERFLSTLETIERYFGKSLEILDLRVTYCHTVLGTALELTLPKLRTVHLSGIPSVHLINAIAVGCPFLESAVCDVLIYNTHYIHLTIRLS